MRNQHLEAALRLALGQSQSGQNKLGTKDYWNRFEPTAREHGILPYFAACRRLSFQLKEMDRSEEQRKFAVDIIDVISRWKPHHKYETEFQSLNRDFLSTASRPTIASPNFSPSADPSPSLDRSVPRQRSALLKPKKSWQDTFRRTTGRVNEQ